MTSQLLVQNHFSLLEMVIPSFNLKMLNARIYAFLEKEHFSLVLTFYDFTGNCTILDYKKLVM